MIQVIDHNKKTITLSDGVPNLITQGMTFNKNGFFTNPNGYLNVCNLTPDMLRQMGYDDPYSQSNKPNK